jgi:hypothetical protein
MNRFESCPKNVVGLLAALLLAASPVPASAHTVIPDQPIYVDALQNGWSSWSWATVSFTNASPVHGGTASISVVADGWEALYLHHAAFDSTGYTALTFWIRGGGGAGQLLQLQAERSGVEQTAVNLPTLTTSWQQVTVTLASLGVANVSNLDGFWIADRSGTTQPVFYVDDMTLVGGTIAPPDPVTVSVDRGADRHAVSPEIFGVCAGADDPLTLDWPVVRWGGNATTRYNWQLDTHNTAMDWFYMNIPDGNGVTNSVDLFIDAVRARGGQPLITLSTIGWTPKLRQKDWGFSQAKYGTQQDNECAASGYPGWCIEDAGNGVYSNGTPVTGNDPTDTSFAITPSFETAWVAHIAARTGTAGAGGVKYFALDNEPALWSSTHRDVHPAKLGYAELWSRTEAYGSAAKTQDPAAKLFGPVEWGWCSYFWSDSDGCGNNNGADYLANGPLLEWYLRSAKQWELTNHKRLLDYLDIHYYPQNNGVSLSNDESAGTAAMRLRSLKSLYDPTYTDESWIASQMTMLPRLRDMIAKNNPGTKIAITEYNFGGVSNDGAQATWDNGITAALAQAEALAIFGREGVDVATRWVMPISNTLVEDAFNLFLSYDGAGSKVAGDSIRAVSSSVDTVGAYGLRGSGSTLYVLLFNKSTLAQTVTLSISGGATGSLTLYGFDASNRLGSAGSAAPGTGGVFSITLPARSARLAVGQLAVCTLPATVANLRLREVSGGNLALTWTNQSSMLDYTVAETPWLTGDFRTSTGTATSGSTGLSVTMPSADRYYRVTARSSCGTGPN